MWKEKRSHDLAWCGRPIAPRRQSGDQDLTIGELARLTGVNAKAIRHYENIGLLPRPKRQANGYRRYGLADVNRLRLLRHIRLLGVSLAAAKPLLVDASDARCAEVRQELLALLERRLIAIDEEIAELRVFKSEVEGYQSALIACCPDQEMRFSDCDDLACIVPDEQHHQEEQHVFPRIH